MPTPVLETTPSSLLLGSKPNGEDGFPTGVAACVARNRGSEVDSLSLTFS